MTSTAQTSQVVEKPARPPRRLGLTLLHLAVLGTVGWGIVGLLAGLIGLGVGLLFVFGIGAIVLLGVFYALFGIAWFETERVASLYDIPAHPLAWRSHPQPGFVGYLKSLGRNLTHGRMWAALGNFLLACLMGTILMAALQGMVQLIISTFAPLTGTDVVTTASTSPRSQAPSNASALRPRSAARSVPSATTRSSAACFPR